MNSKHTSTVSEQFYLAAKDSLFLLERNYPQKSIVKLTGDHYSLTAAERVLLYRGVVAHNKLQHRQQVKCESVPKNSLIYIDGFNVVRTIGSYIIGNFVFVGMDRFLRDVSELHRKALKWPVLERALVLIIESLHALSPKKIVFYFDKPISHSGKIIALAKEEMLKHGLNGNAATVYSPDHELKQIQQGIVCTADSGIIDTAQVPVFDLAAAVLNSNFSPDFFSMVDLVDKDDNSEGVT